MCVCVTSWLVETCPVYYGKAVDIVEPYGSVVVVNLRHVVSAAQPLVDLCHIYISDTVTVVSSLRSPTDADSLF